MWKTIDRFVPFRSVRIVSESFAEGPDRRPNK